LAELGCRFQLDWHDEFAGGSELQVAATTHLELARFAAAKAEGQKAILGKEPDWTDDALGLLPFRI
jgi:hypothetical protein